MLMLLGVVFVDVFVCFICYDVVSAFVTFFTLYMCLHSMLFVVYCCVDFIVILSMLGSTLIFVVVVATLLLCLIALLWFNFVFIRFEQHVYVFMYLI